MSALCTEARRIRTHVYFDENLHGTSCGFLIKVPCRFYRGTREGLKRRIIVAVMVVVYIIGGGFA